MTTGASPSQPALGRLMSTPLQRAARRLVWLLRHGARASGLDQDPAGFVDVGAVCTMLSLDPGDLAEIIAADKKSRFERRGDRLRAIRPQISFASSQNSTTKQIRR